MIILVLQVTIQARDPMLQKTGGRRDLVSRPAARNELLKLELPRTK